MLHFRSYSDMVRVIYSGIGGVPEDVDLIAGIPRSGMLAANILSLALNKPLTDIGGMLEGRIMKSGITRTITQSEPSVGACRKILVIDDSIFSGKSLTLVKKQLSGHIGLRDKLIYAAVFVTEDTRSLVDFYFDICPVPRIFEWNLMHHSILNTSCMDLDGVLCRDPSESEDDDGPKYETFLQQVEPKFRTDYEIGWIVSCRLEKYRGLTEKWLKKNRIAYRHLALMNFATKQERLQAGNHALFKAQNYVSTGAALFIESNRSQAMEIARLSGKPVYCIGSLEWFEPGYSAQAVCLHSAHFAARCLHKLKKILDKSV